METTKEQTEPNRYRLHVTITSSEFDKDVDAAFKKLARSVKIPGFRPGKAPRQLLEAQLGSGVARRQAIEDALPNYVLRAAESEGLDVIALMDDPRENVVTGSDDGDVIFESVIEVRPEVTISGHDSLKLQLDGIAIEGDAIQKQIDALRERFADVADAEHPVQRDGYATIDVNATQNGEEVSGLSVADYLYPVGSGMVVPELDEQLVGKSPGDIFEFSAQPEGLETPVQFKVLVKNVKDKLLPEVTDDWVTEVSEFETISELRDDIGKRVKALQKIRAAYQARDKALDALGELVNVEPPETLVNREIRHRLEDLVRDLQSRKLELADYLAATNQKDSDLVDQLRPAATASARADLALRAVVAAEGIEATDDEVDAEVERLAAALTEKPAKVRKDLERRGAIDPLRFDIAKGKALRFVIDHATVTDDNGEPVELMESETPEKEEQS